MPIKEVCSPMNRPGGPNGPGKPIPGPGKPMSPGAFANPSGGKFRPPEARPGVQRDK